MEPAPTSLRARPALAAAPLACLALAASLCLPLGSPAQETASGIVKVETFPPGAQVHSAGRTYGPTPALIELPEGRHSLLITRDGYVPTTKHVIVKSNRLLRLEVPLEPTVTKGVRVHDPASSDIDSGPGTVQLVTQPPGLRVLMNDIMVPQPTPVAFDIMAGIYELVLEKDGEVVYRRTVFVRSGRTLDLDLTIKKKRSIDDSDPWK